MQRRDLRGSRGWACTPRESIVTTVKRSKAVGGEDREEALYVLNVFLA